MDNEEVIRRASILKVMSHPDRLYILRGIYLSKCTVGDIQHKIGLSQSGLSQHLAKMRDVGIIRGERKGKEICYRVTDSFTVSILKNIFQDLNVGPNNQEK
ncbi:MAG: winged helix-turn-helix transcriptional regulator [Clostridiales bacterium]|nr:winged helix-turn-helix transcriptional regulator [Clostridiales bacterium]